MKDRADDLTTGDYLIHAPQASARRRSSAVLDTPIAPGQPPPVRIGLPMSGTPRSHGNFAEAFKAGMREQGYADATVVYDVVFADGRTERFAPQVQEMVARNPDVVVVAGPLKMSMVHGRSK